MHAARFAAEPECGVMFAYSAPNSQRARLRVNASSAT